MQAVPAFKGNQHRSPDELRQWLARAEREDPIEPDLSIIDPHHHLREDWRGSYLLPELMGDLQAGHNVRATVFIESQAMYRPGGPESLRPVGETEFVVRSILSGSGDGPGAIQPSAGIVGLVDLSAGAEVQSALEAHIAAGQGRFRGVRDPVQWDASSVNYGPRRPARGKLLDPRFRAGFAQLAPLGLSFDAWLFHPQLPELVSLADEFPRSSIVLNHLGMPLGVGPYAGRRAEIFAAWRASLSELARRPNVTIKVGGLGMLFFGFDFHLRDIPPSSAELAEAWKPLIETAIAIFGPRRCMFESNFPVDRQSCGYLTLWNAFKRVTALCSQDEKSELFFGTASRTYGLDRIMGRKARMPMRQCTADQLESQRSNGAC
jgi:predicted TIM-barrel fold metal-dependent hydrolase